MQFNFPEVKKNIHFFFARANSLQTYNKQTCSKHFSRYREKEKHTDTATDIPMEPIVLPLCVYLYVYILCRNVFASPFSVWHWIPNALLYELHFVLTVSNEPTNELKRLQLYSAVQTAIYSRERERE